MTQREKLIELIRETFEYTRGTCIDFDEAVEINADHLLANGVIVPPCKVGDKVYCVLPEVFDNPCEAKIYSITIQAEGTIMRCGVKGFYGVSFMATDFGKKFFAFYDEAEKALAERSEGK